MFTINLENLFVYIEMFDFNFLRYLEGKNTLCPSHSKPIVNA